VKGNKAIREFIEASGSIPGSAIRWEPLEAHVSPSGDFAYLLERNEMSFQDSTGVQVTEWNKVVTVWRKQADGSWKNVIDIWNADPTAWK
jgi:ketosteroid isomerase-like protein